MSRRFAIFGNFWSRALSGRLRTARLLGRTGLDKPVDERDVFLKLPFRNKLGCKSGVLGALWQGRKPRPICH